MAPSVTISTLIYLSPAWADSIYAQVHEFTPELQTGEAIFRFIANDPVPEVLEHLNARKYPYILNENPRQTDDQLFSRGIGGPLYMHYVYRGWNRAIAETTTVHCVLVSSDHFFSPDWLSPLLAAIQDRNILAISRTVEGKAFPGAENMSFGHHPSNYNQEGFLRCAADLRARAMHTPFSPGIVFQPLAARTATISRGYPEGNLPSSTPGSYGGSGDRALFSVLAKEGIEHVTVNASVAYHSGEGEMLRP